MSLETDSKRSNQIQALRALACLLVVLYHAKFISGGYIGVDIFYVISGFLITGIILRELERSNSFSFIAFYGRRFKRLLPASFTVVVSTGLAGWILLPASMRANFGKDVIAASTYISNYLFAIWNNDYQNLGATPSAFIHFWSLAVEEQFYLFWPIFLVILYRKGGRRLLLSGVITVALLSFTFSLWLTAKRPVWSFYILPTRAWELALGALLIFLPLKKVKSALIFAVPAVGLIIAVNLFNESTPFPGTAALVPVLSTALLIATRNSWPKFTEKVVNNRATQYFGDVSYSLYLWHWPVLVLPILIWNRELRLYEILVLLLATLVLSHLTFTYIENPLRYSPWNPKRSLRLATTLTISAVLLGIGIHSSYSNTININDSKYSLDEIRAKPQNNLDGCHLHVYSTVSPICEYGDIHSSQTVVLYGDSHAAQWLPALDEIGKRRHIKIVSLTKSSCPSSEVIKQVTSQYKVADCQRFRDNSIARIAKIRPLAVIATGMQPIVLSGTNTKAKSWWLLGEAKLFSRIKDLTTYPIYLGDTPLPHRDIPDCLVAGEGKACDSSTPIPAGAAIGFHYINPNPWLCGRDCPAMIDGIVVYRDQSHISVAMSKHLSTQLESALRTIGLF